MIRTLATGCRPAGIRLLVSAFLVAAFFASAPAHVHSTVGAEAACASCTLQHHTTSLPVETATIPCGASPESEVRWAETATATAGFARPGQPRAPPFFS